ncbi:MAG: C4-dicarboxylate ABC transporter permease [Gammaproteobacteria bacterium]|jgi:C4-dicarboxylate transporter DctM subunit|nr:C4-dicarboxylate ABC transporter permease [Gammaproteobacteria bacterium]|tara:strand:- start:9100 stop:10401 length:1302 start_codon:yes stop_codon:yes gene_type:complete
MDLILIGILGVVFLLVLLAFGVPIAFAMAFTGVVGLWVVEGPSPTMAHAALIPWEHGRDFIFVAVPLFVLMGQLFYHAGLASDLYEGLRKWVGRVPGGMAISSVLACGGFGAVTGSSIATVATMGTIVMPEMRRFKYDSRLATGALAASGTLGILIPPSLIFIFYGVMTETSIGALFIAGIIPGVITALMFSSIILIRCLLNPALGPKGPPASWRERMTAVGRLGPVTGLFFLIIGGIYAGIFTPTEAAGVGCAGVLVAALLQRKLSLKAMRDALKGTTLISAMIFAIIVGGYMMARFLAVTGLTNALVDIIIAAEFGRVGFLILLILLYFVLGAMLDVFGMLVLTIPFILPVVNELGIDPVWFGVFVVIMAELALITPPIGANVFVMRRVAPDVPMEEIFRGVFPFVIGELVVLTLLIMFPDLALWLVYRMG